jgi:hypothetical protein
MFSLFAGVGITRKVLQDPENGSRSFGRKLVENRVDHSSQAEACGYHCLNYIWVLIGIKMKGSSPI